MAYRILLLGRDPDLLQLLRDYLCSAGFDVIEPHSDAAAVELVTDKAVDAILAEASRLRATGLEARDHSLPTIALIDMDQQAEPNGSNNVRILNKPASLRDITRTLAEVGVMAPVERSRHGGDP